MNILSEFFIGNFEDQVYFGTFSWWSNIFSQYSGYLFHNPFLGKYGFTYEILNSNQPLIWSLVGMGYYLFSQVPFYNFLVLLTFGLNWMFSYKYFKYLWGKGFTSFVFSTLFAFSPYVILHSGRHLDLAFVGLIPLFFTQIHKYFLSNNTDNDFTLGLKKIFVLISVQTLISNYYGFFMLIAFCSFILTFCIQKWVFHSELYLSLNRVIKLIVFFVILGVFWLVTLNSYIQKSYLVSIQEPVFNRNIEDFFYFSTRPWYFFIPPTNNLIYGNLSTHIFTLLGNIKYFWFDNYFLFEHGGNFLGFGAVLLSILCLLYKNKFVPHIKGLIFANLGVSVLLAVSALPPFFTLSGLKIYLPSVFLFEFANMFRSTNRLSVFILLSVLTVGSVFFNYLVVNKKLGLILCVLLLFGFDLLTPLKFQDIRKVPDHYQFLSEVPLHSTIAFYPSKRSEVFWLGTYQKKLINPDSYNVKDFDANTFTKSITTLQGLENLKANEVNYLVLYKNSLDDFEFNVLQNSQLNIVFETPETYIMSL